MNYDPLNAPDTALDEDFRSPITQTGVVLVNGCIAKGSVISATRNPCPRYKLPLGNSVEMVRRTRKCAIAYRIIDEDSYLADSYARPSNATVACLTSLNGQGLSGESQAQFMKRIQPIGIVLQETDQNGSDLFNVHVGGIYTMINNSNRDIVAGDWLMVYAPRLDEVKQGGRGKEHDANGYVELWMVPYHPSIHQVTTAHIYQCLSMRYNDRNPAKPHSINGKEYLPEYETMCDHLLDAFMDLGLIFTEFLARNNYITVHKDNTSATPAADADERAKAYTKLFSRLDHSLFTSKTDIQHELRKALIDAFFLSRVSQKEGAAAKADFFAPKAKNDVNMRKLRECQVEAPSICLMETARFSHTITKNVFGKAVTSAAPKKNLNVQLCSMIGCK